MDLSKVGCGNNAPKEVNVIIEIPAQSSPVKYEVDKKTGAMFVDRFVGTAMFYPCNYGYVPNTLSEDGDPVDVLVITPVPLITGAVIAVRPIGVLNMTDEKGNDAKILAVPVDKLSPLYTNIKSPEDIPVQTRSMIEHFFEHYKDLEQGKWVKLAGWDGVQAAFDEISSSIARFQGVPVEAN